MNLWVLWINTQFWATNTQISACTCRLQFSTQPQLCSLPCLGFKLMPSSCCYCLSLKNHTAYTSIYITHRSFLTSAFDIHVGFPILSHCQDKSQFAWQDIRRFFLLNPGVSQSQCFPNDLDVAATRTCSSCFRLASSRRAEATWNSSSVDDPQPFGSEKC